MHGRPAKFSGRVSPRRSGSRLSALLIAFALLSAPRAAAQEDFNHPELEWKTIETAHFLVHYHQGAGRTGRTVAKIAEEIYAVSYTHLTLPTNREV